MDDCLLKDPSGSLLVVQLVHNVLDQVGHLLDDLALFILDALGFVPSVMHGDDLGSSLVAGCHLQQLLDGGVVHQHTQISLDLFQIHLIRYLSIRLLGR